MSVGYPTDKATVDASFGNGAIAIRNDLDQWVARKAWLDSKTDADLTALGYTAADIQSLRNNAQSFAKLATIAHGQDVQAAAADFFFWSKQITGLN